MRLHTRAPGPSSLVSRARGGGHRLRLSPWAGEDVLLWLSLSPLRIDWGARLAGTGRGAWKRALSVQACLRKLGVCRGERIPGPPTGHIFGHGDIVTRLAMLTCGGVVTVCDQGWAPVTGLEQGQWFRDLLLTEATWPGSVPGPPHFPPPQPLLLIHGFKADTSSSPSDFDPSFV